MAIANFIRYTGWRWVNTLATRDAYGLDGEQQLYAELMKIDRLKVRSRQLLEVMTHEPTNSQRTEIEARLRTIREGKSRIIILFCTPGAHGWPTGIS